MMMNKPQRIPLLWNDGFFGQYYLYFIIFIILFVFGIQTRTYAEEAKTMQNKLEINISASDDVNPDDKGRPSPVKVRIYELKTDAAFNSADYFSLNNQEKAVLGDDLLKSDMFILRPGESRKIQRKSQSETTVIAVLVGYQDLANSTWNITYKIPLGLEATWYRSLLPLKKVKFNVELTKQRVRIVEPN